MRKGGSAIYDSNNTGNRDWKEFVAGGFQLLLKTGLAIRLLQVTTDQGGCDDAISWSSRRRKFPSGGQCKTAESMKYRDTHREEE